MSKIKTISAREILDSKGNPAVQATVELQDGSIGIGSSPNGTLISKYENFKLIDNDPNRFKGLGVLKAVANINSLISPQLIDSDAIDQAGIDKKLINLDGTNDKINLGANSIYPVSVAIAKAAAQSAKIPLFLYLREYIGKQNEAVKIPTPMFNIINGGKHTFNSIDFQEFLIIPASSNNFITALSIGININNSLKELLETKGLTTLVSVDGGFSPPFSSNKEAITTLNEAVLAIKLKLGFDVFLGIDASANNFYSDGRYKIKDQSKTNNSSDLINYYQEISSTFNLLYLEDGLYEEDWDGWQNLQSRLSDKTIISGDNLTATNPNRIQEAIKKNTINSITIKPDQAGTVIQALAISEVAKLAGLKLIASSRSGETNDDFIADFAVAINADYSKFGAPVRGERVAKYNRLLEINSILTKS